MAHEHAQPGVVLDLNTFGGSTSTAVVKEKNFEVIRIVVEAGKPIPPHKVEGPITVQCLSGRCTFFVGEEPRELVSGSWLYLTGGTIHALESEENAILLVSILFNRTD
ncbi:cupin domain-containing protein [Adhaeretor mobilis]|uniref:Cupin n=1 Tax=Adhaeretor mobilis TaxID=1930276 RepID=A0A517MRS1_9BACT|nr:cupin domain-containing protein [Adhaeretor mobilis]QDS97573.1 hypothetical protein HG15A2_08360 [Adhaeretor mobilis]